MTEPVEFLDLDDVVGLAIALLGDPPPIRDLGLLGSAIARPQTTAFGNDAYPSIWLKAAALLDSMVNNHALVDGNKRLGWLSTAVFLEINGVAVSQASNGAVYDLVYEVAATNLAIRLAVRRGFSDAIECGATAANLGSDVGCGRGPHERIRVVVPV